jgi:hypothetical protein
MESCFVFPCCSKWNHSNGQTLTQQSPTSRRSNLGVDISKSSFCQFPHWTSTALSRSGILDHVTPHSPFPPLLDQLSLSLFTFTWTMSRRLTNVLSLSTIQSPHMSVRCVDPTSGFSFTLSINNKNNVLGNWTTVVSPDDIGLDEVVQKLQVRRLKGLISGSISTIGKSDSGSLCVPWPCPVPIQSHGVFLTGQV